LDNTSFILLQFKYVQLGNIDISDEEKELRMFYITGIVGQCISFLSFVSCIHSCAVVVVAVGSFVAADVVVVGSVDAYW
jgi:hypothetical protein